MAFRARPLSARNTLTPDRDASELGSVKSVDGGYTAVKFGVWVPLVKFISLVTVKAGTF